MTKAEKKQKDEAALLALYQSRLVSYATFQRIKKYAEINNVLVSEFMKFAIEEFNAQRIRV